MERSLGESSTSKIKFIGNTNALKDNIYDLSYAMGDQYTKTTRAIAKYLGREYKNGAEAKLSVEQLTAHIIPIPTERILHFT